LNEAFEGSSLNTRAKSFPAIAQQGSSISGRILLWE
jgi:hypothetical protein